MDIDVNNILIILGFSIVLVLLGFFVALASSRGKKKTINQMKSQINILDDELERHKKENFHLRDELKRINSLDNLFFASMIRLTAKLNPVEIANEATGFLVNYLNANEIAVFLLDEKGKRLNIVAQHGLNENWIPKLVYNLGEGKVGVTAENRIPYGEQEFAALGMKEPYPIFSPDLCYPLIYQNRRFGVIAIRQKNKFEEREKNLLGVVSAITAVALNNTLSFATLQDYASTDPLTKLYNIGYFKDHLLEELSRAKKFRHNLSITIIDLDKFKNYNDTYGHQAGDHLLIQLSQIFSKHFNKPDILARYGGDEFIILFPETKKHDAANIIDALLKELIMSDFTRGEKGIKVTFSAGVSSFPEDGNNVSELIKSADDALYKAKRSGGNTVQLYSPKIDKI